MRRRVLIVTSTYAPAMMADMQRARLLAWELPSCGWDVEVLSPDASYQVPVCVDDDSAAFFCRDTPVHYAAQGHGALFRMMRMRSIGWRAYGPLNRVARRLFTERRYDLVYFSTTQFSLFTLGRLWRKTSGVPYVLDFHDPCSREAPSFYGGTRRGLRRAASERIARVVESTATSAADGLVCVSPRYLDDLRARYAHTAPPWLRAGRHAVIPFAGSERDLALGATRLQQARAADGKRRIVYVGAGGPVMKTAFTALCRGLVELRQRASPVLDDIVIELYGTLLHWRDGDARDLCEIAQAHGLADLVHEAPRRVSYRRSIELLLGAQGALVLGVEDAGYMPSKLYAYALSGHPLLAVLDATSPGYAAFQELGGLGHCVPLGGEASAPAHTAPVIERFLHEVANDTRHDRRALLQPYLAPAMAQRHAELFEACLAGGGS